ncbi:hypothetical protein HK405_006571, partial [Cladochytrium tenue]
TAAVPDIDYDDDDLHTVDHAALAAAWAALDDENPAVPLQDDGKDGGGRGGPRVRDFGLSDLLALPAAFGSIYLGETFSSYLCVNNESSAAGGARVTDVAIKAELQTATQRLTLADTTSSAAAVAAAGTGADATSAAAATPTSLAPGESAEFLVHHEIKELGIHILVCSVHYTPTTSSDSTPAGTAAAADSAPQPPAARQFFRKFYKFQVLNPLAVKTKVNSLLAPDAAGRVLLEAQVQNVSGSPMFLDRVAFDPNPLFVHADLAVLAVDDDDNDNDNDAAAADGDHPAAAATRSVFGPSRLLANLDTRQYLYLLTPRPAATAIAAAATTTTTTKSTTDSVTASAAADPAGGGDPFLARTAPTLGKLDIAWRSALGQLGRLQTSQLARKVQPPDPFELAAAAAAEDLASSSSSSDHLVDIGDGRRRPRPPTAERPFRLRAAVRNNLPLAPAALRVDAAKQRMGSVLVQGPSTVYPSSSSSFSSSSSSSTPSSSANDSSSGSAAAADVPPLAAAAVDLRFFPLVPGLHRVTGLRVVDERSGAARDVDALADVFVEVPEW